jgi:dolichol-phosphate mannosyltransferase
LGCRFAEVPFVLRYDQKKGGSKMVGSLTMLGYLIMGMLYWWPFGGWRSQYRGLRKMYREDAQKAVETYKLGALKRRRTASRINL